MAWTAPLTSYLTGVHPYACLFIDTTWRDMLLAYKDVLVARDRERLHQQIQQQFHPHALVTIAVRTAFDLWLRVKKFPKGSEISTWGASNVGAWRSLSWG